MKRTRKWAFVSQEASRLAGLGYSGKEIAGKLDVDVATVRRWMREGKLPRTSGAVSTRAPGTMKARQSPAEWATAVRAEYALDVTDDQLVTLAESALEESLDMHRGTTVRLQAMGRFQAIVKQLALVARAAEAEHPTPKPEEQRATRPVAQRPGVDPRMLLKAVG